MYKYVYWELTGGGFGKDWYNIYFAPQDGRGFYFDINGKKYKFSWVHPRSGYKCDFKILPEDIQYSLLHYGELPSIKVPRELKINPENLMELINADPNFRKVNKEHTRAHSRLKRAILDSLEDISKYKKEINLLRKIGIPRTFTEQIFKLTRQNSTKVINGEIGIASFIDSYKLSYILDTIIGKNEEIKPSV